MTGDLDLENASASLRTGISSAINDSSAKCEAADSLTHILLNSDVSRFFKKHYPDDHASERVNELLSQAIPDHPFHHFQSASFRPAKDLFVAADVNDETFTLECWLTLCDWLLAFDKEQLVPANKVKTVRDQLVRIIGPGDGNVVFDDNFPLAARGRFAE